MARLSTHVLDTAHGTPAWGVRVELHFVSESGRHAISSARTNADGRTTPPLLEGDRLEIGIYELTFHAGDYFRGAGVVVSDPPFLDQIVIRVGISDPIGTYHIPLLLAPYGYSTYRGS